MLHNLFEYPKDTGDVANARAAHFEGSVQAVIDSSPWRPPVELVRKHLGKELILDGRSLTDIDAIGECGDTLLLVNAKSVRLSAMYSAGDYRETRNNISRLREELASWNKTMAKLDGRRRGDGGSYDFSLYRRIIAPLCTLLPVYLPIDLANQWSAPRLRAICSLSELSQWLRETTPEVMASWRVGGP
jgi:hypothetical protein